MTSLTRARHRCTGHRRTTRARVVSTRIQTHKRNRRIFNALRTRSAAAGRLVEGRRKKQQSGLIDPPQADQIQPGVAGASPASNHRNGSGAVSGDTPVHPGNGQNGKLIASNWRSYTPLNKPTQVIDSWTIDDNTRVERLDEANRAKNLPAWLIEYDRRFDPVQVMTHYTTKQYIPPMWDKRG